MEENKQTQATQEAKPEPPKEENKSVPAKVEAKIPRKIRTQSHFRSSDRKESRSVESNKSTVSARGLLKRILPCPCSESRQVLSSWYLSPV